jgi:hypothetical protein
MKHQPQVATLQTPDSNNAASNGGIAALNAASAQVSITK